MWWHEPWPSHACSALKGALGWSWYHPPVGGLGLPGSGVLWTCSSWPKLVDESIKYCGFVQWGQAIQVNNVPILGVIRWNP